MGEIRNVDGWLWPADDTECQKVAFNLGSLKEAVGYCQNFRCAVQAGGNVGVWPSALSEKFETVYTFEPDPDNFACLAANVTAPNVFKFQCGLGEKSWPTSYHRIDGNCGAGFLGNTGRIPVLTLDAMCLQDVDLLCLDIEGMEFRALRGAADLIRLQHPVIMVEQKGLSSRYGTSEDDLKNYLASFGYHEKARVHADTIYVHGMRK